MNNIIIEGGLLYSTFFYILCVIMGIESIVDNGLTLYALIIAGIMILACYLCISEENFKKLTFNGD